MNRVQPVTTDQFERDVLGSKLPVLVDFYASWCPPCRKLMPMLDKLAPEYAGRVKFVKVNTDDAQDLAAKFKIQGVPTLMFFADGEMVDTVVGAPPLATLRQKLDTVAGDAETTHSVTKETS